MSGSITTNATSVRRLWLLRSSGIMGEMRVSKTAMLAALVAELSKHEP
jgi:hypothetical protein